MKKHRKPVKKRVSKNIILSSHPGLYNWFEAGSIEIEDNFGSTLTGSTFDLEEAKLMYKWLGKFIVWMESK